MTNLLGKVSVCQQMCFIFRVLDEVRIAFTKTRVSLVTQDVLSLQAEVRVFCKK